GAVLRDANLTGAMLAGANLRNADLQGAKLEGADLAGADTTGANLARSADNFSVQIQQALHSHYTWINTNGTMGARADLTG
ncbi:pentapeptide repeat-containing protein, partial [Acinetobacter baumannii]